MNESKLQQVNSYPIYPRDSKTNADKVFVNTDLDLKEVLIGLVL